MGKRLTHFTMVVAAIMGFFAPAPTPAPPSSSLFAPKTASLEIVAEPDVNFDPVRHLSCGSMLGTGVVIGNGLVLTAAHVINGATSCHDNITGRIGWVSFSDTSMDIALLTFAPDAIPRPVMKISCDGFIHGGIYYSIGWEHGEKFVMNQMLALGQDNPISMVDGRFYYDLAILLGRVIPGMSGGPIINERGEMVGMNNVTDGIRGYSREMADTPLCQKH